ncbi:hypothetical protein QQ045_001884 [Rhodiola kirilowii]
MDAHYSLLRDPLFEGRVQKYTRNQLMQFRVALAAIEEIMKIKREIDAELFGEEQQYGGPAPALVKAEAPWSARSGNLSEQERVFKTIKGILNKLTPNNFDNLTGQIIDSGQLPIS